MIVQGKDCRPQTLENGMVRVVKGYLDDLMVVEMHFQAGMEGAPHSHPHRQAGYVIKGSFEGVVNGEKAVLKAGDCYYTRANEVHGLKAMEDGSVLLDIFTPKRDDFIN